MEAKFKILGKKHVNLLNAHVDLNLLSAQLKKENKQLRGLLQQANNDCKVAQESLDGAQREIERLHEKLSRTEPKPAGYWVEDRI